MDILVTRVGTVVVGALILVLPLMLGGVVPRATLLLLVSCASLGIFVAISVAAKWISVDGDDAKFFLVWMVISVLILIDPLFELFDFRKPEITKQATDVVTIKSVTLSAINYWAKFSAYILICWMASRVTRKQSIALVCCVLAMGLFQMLYGMGAYISDSRTILGIWDRPEVNVNTGTFYNPNHFSGYLELCLPLLLGVALYYRKVISRRSRIFLAVVAVMCMILLTVVISTSKSRLGLASMVVGLVVFIYLAKDMIMKPRFRSLFIGAIALLCFAGIVWFGVEQLLSDYLNIFQFEVPRLRVWMDTFAFPVEWWIFGIGPGRFGEFYPLVQSAHISRFYAHLHNDVMQFILELGLIRTIIIASAVYYLTLNLFANEEKSSLHAGATAAVVAILVHSFGDFNLQIIGVAIVFWVTLGLIVNKSLPPLERKVTSKRKRRSKRRSSHSHDKPATA